MVGVSSKTIAYWETSSVPPRSDVLPELAKALGVGVEDILGAKPPEMRRPGPVGKLQRVFEEALVLPRREQALVAKFVATLVEQHRKAS
jgi:transcriptional regulator with XRE-family HTH domain